MRMHMGVSVDGALDAAQYRAEHRMLKSLFMVNSIKEVRKILLQAKVDGLDRITNESCDNQDAKGHCLGHESPYIKRVRKEVSDAHIARHAHDTKPHPIKVLMIGHGRFYLSTASESDEVFQKFVQEWQASNGAELPSFPLEEAAS